MNINQPLSLKDIFNNFMQNIHHEEQSLSIYYALVDLTQEQKRKIKIPEEYELMDLYGYISNALALDNVPSLQVFMKRKNDPLDFTYVIYYGLDKSIPLEEILNSPNPIPIYDYEIIEFDSILIGTFYNMNSIPTYNSIFSVQYFKNNIMVVNTINSHGIIFQPIGYSPSVYNYIKLL